MPKPLSAHLRKTAAVCLAVSAFLMLFCGCNIARNISQVADVADDILPMASGEEDASAASEPDETAVNMRAAQTDIGLIIRDIYSDDVLKGVIVGDDNALSSVLLIDPDTVEEYRLVYTDGIYGVQDVCIIKPKEGYKATIIELLRQWNDSRTAFFEHYDVNGAYDIIRNAEIYSQGEYVIYLAVKNMELARLSVDKHIQY